MQCRVWTGVQSQERSAGDLDGRAEEDRRALRRGVHAIRHEQGRTRGLRRRSRHRSRHTSRRMRADATTEAGFAVVAKICGRITRAQGRVRCRRCMRCRRWVRGRACMCRRGCMRRRRCRSGSSGALGTARRDRRPVVAMLAGSGNGWHLSRTRHRHVHDPARQNLAEQDDEHDDATVNEARHAPSLSANPTEGYGPILR